MKINTLSGIDAMILYINIMIRKILFFSFNMLNIRLKYQKTNFLTLQLNNCIFVCNCILFFRLFIYSLFATIIISVNRLKRKKNSGFKDTYYAGAIPPEGRYIDK